MQGVGRTNAAEGAPPVAPDAMNPYRLRIVGGMTMVLQEKGYAAATIADIARHAHVSKRTFYEHFADKDSCFIAVYETLSGVALEAVVHAMSRRVSWEKRMRGATKAYLEFLESHPTLTRTLMMDIYAAGPEALKVRRDVLRRFADLLRRLVEQGRKDHADLPSLSEAMATAVIGGINELILVAVEEGRADRLSELAETADALLRAALAP